MALFRRSVTAAACIAAFFAFMPFLPAMANDNFRNLTVVSTSTLDLSSGRISGERVPYFIDFTSLHSGWTDDVVAERDIIGGASPVVERMRLYLRSYTRRGVVQRMFSIYVSDRWDVEEDEIPFDIVRRSRDFIFAVEYGAGFTEEDDAFFFAHQLRPMDTPIRMRRFITFPPEQEPDHRNTVFVDGVPMNAPTRNVGGQHLVQLREAAEIMGYTVGWNVVLRTVRISSSIFNDTFVVSGDMTQDARGIAMRLIDGRTYVSTQYFAGILGRHISFDPRTGNISIA